MDVKPCPYCGKQLPAELSFCPYCMHSLAEERISPVQRTIAPPWFRYGLGAVLVLCALLSAVWLLPRRTVLPPGATATDTVAETASGSEETSGLSGPLYTLPKGESSFAGPVFWNPSASSAVLPSGIFTPPMGDVASAGFSSSANRPALVPSAEPGSPVSQTQNPPASGASAVTPAVSSVPSSGTESSSVTSSEGEALPEVLRILMERSEKEFERYLALWNQTAKEIGYGQYAIAAYDVDPLAIGGIEIDKTCDYFLFLSNIRLAGGCRIDNLRWQCSADRSEIGSGCSVLLIYLPVSASDAIPEPDLSYINYLALSTFTQYRDDSFVENFYTDEGWQQVILRNSGIHNGWFYRKQGTYNGFRFEDGYTEYFEDLEINQGVIAALGTNISRNHMFEFSYWKL